MTLPISYRLEARDDIDAIYVDYEKQQTGLGDRFLVALQDLTDLIQTNPALFGVIYQDVWAAPLRGFPHVVYYRVEPSRILIIAVQHGRRRSRVWQSRV